MNDTPINMRELVGKTVDGRYQLETYLAEGNFGAVYRATQMAYGVSLRQVAVKVSKRPMSDSEARKIFGDALLMARVVDSAEQEQLRMGTSRGQGQLRMEQGQLRTLSQHFVQVYDAGRCPESDPLPGHPYLVMEFIPGGSLRQQLKSGPFALTRAINYFNQILEAMAFMHGGMERPIAHRDLKTDNILVKQTEDGKDRVMVTDFGLAIEVDTLLGWVQSGGDLAYLAPESFSHNIASPQSDVYMLGLIFYEMISGHNPFSRVGIHLKGDKEEKQQELRQLHLAARQHEHFNELEQHIELRNRPELVGVIRTALASDMLNRTYNNARELQAAWKQALIGGQRPPNGEKHPWDQVRSLTHSAEQCFAVSNVQEGEARLEQALAINRSRVSDPMMVGRTYLLKVQRLLLQGRAKEAGELANEGYRRRKCHSTIKAMEAYYRSVQSPLAAGFTNELARCADRE